MGLFFPSKKSMPTGGSGNIGGSSLAHKFDHNSLGKITPRELKLAERRLISGVGRHDARRIMEGLRPNLDSDGHRGGRNITEKEGNETLDYMKGGSYGLGSKKIEKAREILSEYE